jgi:hypothetical protein
MEVKMKAHKITALMIGLLFATSVITLAKDKDKDPDPSPSSNKYLKEHQDIRKDLKGINANRNEIASLKAELKADRKAKLKTDVIVDKKEITKSKADLRANKAYLRADKKDLMRDRRLAVKEERKNVCEQRMALNDAKRQLRKDLRTDNAVLIHDDAVAVTRHMAKYEVAKIALRDEKIDRNNDMLAVNDEIRASKPGFAPATYVENSRAHASNWMLK